MHWLPPIFFVGVLLNVVLCLFFKLRVDREATRHFNDFRSSVSAEIINMTTNALQSIDNYFVSNSVPRSSSEFLAPHFTGDEVPTMKDAGVWSYTYFEANGRRYARVGIRNYTEGDIFPRGGVISSIHPDGVVLDGSYWIANQSTSSGKFSASNISPPSENSKLIKGLSKHE